MCGLKTCSLKSNIDSHVLEGQMLSLRQDYVNIRFPFSKARSWKFYIVNMLRYERGPRDYNFIAVIEKRVPQYLTCSVLSHVLLFLHMLAVYQVGVPHFLTKVVLFNLRWF